MLTGLAAWWWTSAQAPRLLPEGGEIRDFKDGLRAFENLLKSQPLATLLLPFRWMIRPGLAGSVPEFLRVAWPAFLALALHYIWVIRSDVAFEEASLEQARQRASRLSAHRREPSHVTSRKARRARSAFIQPARRRWRCCGKI